MRVSSVRIRCEMLLVVMQNCLRLAERGPIAYLTHLPQAATAGDVFGRPLTASLSVMQLYFWNTAPEMAFFKPT